MKVQLIQDIGFMVLAGIILVLSLAANSWQVAVYLLVGFFLGVCGAALVFLLDGK